MTAESSVGAHPIHRVVSFKLIGPQALQVDFDDGTTRAIDFQPVLMGEIFSPLHDPDVFSQVRIDPETHTLVWPNGADFDPATLHDWQDHEPLLESMARTWRASGDRNGS